MATAFSRKKTCAPLPPVVMKAMNGQTLRPEDWQGKAVVLDFWASWFAHCLVDFPALERIQLETPGLEVVGVNIDEPELAGAARKILAERHLSKVVEQWKPRGRE
jgi:cytochrome c biogenesis protein CcmG, thiol:disulfide interchange protein DsbE